MSRSLIPSNQPLKNYHIYYSHQTADPMNDFNSAMNDIVHPNDIDIYSGFSHSGEDYGNFNNILNNLDEIELNPAILRQNAPKPPQVHHKNIRCLPISHNSTHTGEFLSKTISKLVDTAPKIPENHPNPSISQNNDNHSLSDDDNIPVKPLKSRIGPDIFVFDLPSPPQPSQPDVSAPKQVDTLHLQVPQEPPSSSHPIQSVQPHVTPIKRATRSGEKLTPVQTPVKQLQTSIQPPSPEPNTVITRPEQIKNPLLRQFARQLALGQLKTVSPEYVKIPLHSPFFHTEYPPRPTYDLLANAGACRLCGLIPQVKREVSISAHYHNHQSYIKTYANAQFNGIDVLSDTFIAEFTQKVDEFNAKGGGRRIKNSEKSQLPTVNTVVNPYIKLRFKTIDNEQDWIRGCCVECSYEFPNGSNFTANMATHLKNSLCCRGLESGDARTRWALTDRSKIIYKTLYLMGNVAYGNRDKLYEGIITHGVGGEHGDEFRDFAHNPRSLIYNILNDNNIPIAAHCIPELQNIPATEHIDPQVNPEAYGRLPDHVHRDEGSDELILAPRKRADNRITFSKKVNRMTSSCNDEGDESENSEHEVPQAWYMLHPYMVNGDVAGVYNDMSLFPIWSNTDAFFADFWDHNYAGFKEILQRSESNQGLLQELEHLKKTSTSGMKTSSHTQRYKNAKKSRGIGQTSLSVEGDPPIQDAYYVGNADIINPCYQFTGIDIDPSALIPSQHPSLLQSTHNPFTGPHAIPHSYRLLDIKPASSTQNLNLIDYDTSKKTHYNPHTNITLFSPTGCIMSPATSGLPAFRNPHKKAFTQHHHPHSFYDETQPQSNHTSTRFLRPTRRRSTSRQEPQKDDIPIPRTRSTRTTPTEHELEINEAPEEKLDQGYNDLSYDNLPPHRNRREPDGPIRGGRNYVRKYEDSKRRRGRPRKIRRAPTSRFNGRYSREQPISVEENDDVFSDNSDNGSELSVLGRLSGYSESIEILPENSGLKQENLDGDLSEDFSDIDHENKPSKSKNNSPNYDGIDHNLHSNTSMQSRRGVFDILSDDDAPGYSSQKLFQSPSNLRKNGQVRRITTHHNVSLLSDCDDDHDDQSAESDEGELYQKSTDNQKNQNHHFSQQSENNKYSSGDRKYDSGSDTDDWRLYNHKTNQDLLTSQNVLKYPNITQIYPQIHLNNSIYSQNGSNFTSLTQDIPGSQQSLYDQSNLHKRTRNTRNNNNNDRNDINDLEDTSAVKRQRYNEEISSDSTNNNNLVQLSQHTAIAHSAVNTDLNGFH